MLWQISEHKASEYGLIENVLRKTVEADTLNEAIEILTNYGFEIVGASEIGGNIIVRG